MITNIFITIALVGIVAGIFLVFKNNNTYKNHIIIVKAIGEHNRHLIRTDFDKFIKLENDSPTGRVLWDDIESYSKTFFRWWDWGYTRILPPDKFEMVKPFIKSYKEIKREAKK